MKKGLLSSVACAFSLSLAASSALADVSIDENGMGFVGKGDVQTVYGWNDAQFQSQATLLQFRFSANQSATWLCVGINPQGKRIEMPQSETSIGVSATVAYDLRRNSQGKVTGINLTGFDHSQPQYAAAGSCPQANGFLVPPALEGEINWIGSGEPSLLVSVDGQIWLDLPITY